MHSLFDFSFEGDLRLPEVTILVRTALIACAKVSLLVLWLTVIKSDCLVVLFFIRSVLTWFRRSLLSGKL